MPRDESQMVRELIGKFLFELRKHDMSDHLRLLARWQKSVQDRQLEPLSVPGKQYPLRVLQSALNGLQKVIVEAYRKGGGLMNPPIAIGWRKRTRHSFTSW